MVMLKMLSTMIGFVEEVTEIKEVNEEEASVIGNIAKEGDGSETGHRSADVKATGDSELDFENQISKDLTSDERARVMQVLNFYRDCFRGPGDKLAVAIWAKFTWTRAMQNRFMLAQTGLPGKKRLR